MVMRYSPSVGKLCLKPMPPRVPRGRGTSGFELAAMEYFVLATFELGLPTAKLLEDNPLLVRLKELETLEKVAEKVEKITVNGGFDTLLSDLVTLRDRS